MMNRDNVFDLQLNITIQRAHAIMHVSSMHSNRERDIVISPSLRGWLASGERSGTGGRVKR
jgi:hypothetical protein